MNERIKEIRQNLHLTQEQFANKLGIGRSTVAGFELGRPLKERTIKQICKIFKINENWLRTGEGEMYLTMTDSQQFNEVLAEWLVDSDPLTKETLMLLASLNDEDFKIASRIIKGLAENK
ncbi:helix-turn-helix domain-containing protein [Clostridium perfringens]|uniref:helix-turn-helix domain-containing protein n=1 Tax=Clostridium perfringens TaxID=1502 RepID=UPI0024BC5931|nr:helix-turn-helix transcriptional regulator [Clostridium perfringens]